MAEFEQDSNKEPRTDGGKVFEGMDGKVESDEIELQLDEL